MRVIEELVDHLRASGALTEKDVEWLQEKGFLPGDNYDDWDCPDEWEQNEEADDPDRYLIYDPDEANRLEEGKHRRRGGRRKHKPTGHAQHDQPASVPANHQAHVTDERHRQLELTAKLQAADALPRQSAIAALLDCLTTRTESMHGPVSELLLKLASESSQAYLQWLLQLKDKGLLEQAHVIRLSAVGLERGSGQQHNFNDSLMDLLLQRSSQAEPLIEFLFSKVLTLAQRKVWLGMLLSNYSMLTEKIVSCALEFVADEDMPVRLQALELLHLSGMGRLIDQDCLWNALFHSDPKLQYEALRLFFSTGYAPDLNTLVHFTPYLNQPDSSIAEFAAAILARTPFRLILDHLTSISDGVAEQLSRHRGAMMTLHGLTGMSDAAATSLSKYRGWLMIRDLRQVSPKARQLLSVHQNVTFG